MILWTLTERGRAYVYRRHANNGFSAICDSGVVQLMAVSYAMGWESESSGALLIRDRADDREIAEEDEFLYPTSIHGPLLHRVRDATDAPIATFRAGTGHGDFPGLRVYQSGSRYDYEYRYIVIPLWAVSAVLLVLPAILAFSNTTRTRQLRGCCSVCGYDLRASKDRCPECGTPIPAGSSTTILLS